MTTSPNVASPTTPLTPTPITADVPPSEHLNVVRLVGDLAAAAQDRELPGGDWVSTFRVSVRTDPTANGHRGRSDSIDCVAVTAATRNELAEYEPGDVIEVSGSLRHRYWRAGSGLNSRYEVEVVSLRRQPAPA